MQENPDPGGQSTDIMRALEAVQAHLIDDADSLESTEEEQDPFAFLSFASLLGGRSFVPDIVSNLLRKLPLLIRHQSQESF